MPVNLTCSPEMYRGTQNHPSLVYNMLHWGEYTTMKSQMFVRHFILYGFLSLNYNRGHQARIKDCFSPITRWILALELSNISKNLHRIILPPAARGEAVRSDERPHHKIWIRPSVSVTSRDVLSLATLQPARRSSPHRAAVLILCSLRVLWSLTSSAQCHVGSN